MNGIVPSLSIAAYRDQPGLSKSQLDLLRESPQIFHEFQLGNYKPETTPAMQIGTFVHSAILEGRCDYAVQPTEIEDENGAMVKWDGRKTICKLWTEKQTKPIITENEAAKINAMVWACNSDPFASLLFANGNPEMSLFAKDESGRLFKARPDWLAANYIVDIKTTTSATTEEFSKEIYNRRYHVQAALYLRVAGWCGLSVQKFYFVAIQKSNPPRVNVRELHESALDLGSCELDDDLALLRECEASGNWFGYSGKSGAIEKIDVPQWAHERYAAKNLALTVGGKAVNF